MAKDLGTQMKERVHRLVEEGRGGRRAREPREVRSKARSLAIAQHGLATGFDTINMLTATITDVLEENVTVGQANVVVNAIGKVLKVVELQFKYGKPRPDGRERDLRLQGGAIDATKVQ